MIAEILNILHTYPVQVMAAWAACQWAFGVVVDALPEPAVMDSVKYRFLYKVAHGLAGNRSEFKKQF